MARNDFSEQIVSLMQSYTEDVKETAVKIVKEVGDEARQMVKATAQVRTGDYKKSIKVKHSPTDTETGFEVYSSNRYQLTHLLEHGHQNRDETQSKAFPHIEPAQTWTDEEVMKRLEKELKG